MVINKGLVTRRGFFREIEHAERERTSNYVAEKESIKSRTPTVGAVGSHFSWTESGTAGYRIWKPFSIWGGYQAYGINNDRNGEIVAFDGTIRGIVTGLTIHL